MKQFMDDNFLLKTETAVELYHNYAKQLPIYDYHCHLNAKEIWDNKRYENITQAWLYGDHYKWRAMRSNGVEEEYITGNKIDYEKFIAFTKTVQYAIGNPLYHWSHLELKRYFEIEEVLNEENAHHIWLDAADKLKQNDFSARGLIEKSNVDVICTTDDPIDSLEYHIKIQKEGKMKTKVLPTFRPDKALEIRKNDFPEYVRKLADCCGAKMDSYGSLLSCLATRVDYFHVYGCRIADHSLEYVPYREASGVEVNSIFEKVMRGGIITAEDEEKYKTSLLGFLGRIYAKYKWTMQLHIGAMRNNNTSMFKNVGMDAGFDSMNDLSIAYPLSRFLDSLSVLGMLPKTILYTLNPKDNYVLGTMIGNFQGGGVPSKIQFGSAWWFNDQKDGIEQHLTTLANLGLLNRFVGMLTDSRSFLSYTRHEYFRRILCNLIGEWVENGEYPKDMKMLGKIVQDVCYNNAKKYFGI